MENGLTELGVAQAEAAAARLLELGVEYPIMWYSIWAKASQTADILAARLRISSERRFPEYSYLDARGTGLFEGSNLTTGENIFFS